MKNDKPLSKLNVSIDSKTDVAYISQRSIERLLNLSSGTVSKLLKAEKFRTNIYSTIKGLDGSLTEEFRTDVINENNQLSEFLFKKVLVNYALKGNIKAIDLIDKILDAGIKVFMRGLANCATPKLGKDSKELQNKVKELENKLRKNNRSYKVKAHFNREELHKLGYVEKVTVFYPHYYYPVTELGKSKGYKNKGCGKHKTVVIDN